MQLVEISVKEKGFLSPVSSFQGLRWMRVERAAGPSPSLHCEVDARHCGGAAEQEGRARVTEDSFWTPFT